MVGRDDRRKQSIIAGHPVQSMQGNIGANREAEACLWIDTLAIIGSARSPGLDLDRLVRVVLGLLPLDGTTTDFDA